MDILTKKQAMATGLRKYFTGRQCKNGHLSQRHVHNNVCMECCSANARRWAKRNNTRTAAYARKWRAANPTKAKVTRDKSNANWYLKPENKIRALISVRARNARKLGNGGDHTAQDIAHILAAQAGKCAYFRHCGTVITPSNQHVDHIIPISAGGSNNRHNLQVLCCTCNLSKGPKDPLIHCRSLGWLL